MLNERNFYPTMLKTRKQDKYTMSISYQLDLFEDNDPVSLLQKDFRILDKKCQNVQRGLFARFGTLEETVEVLRDLCEKLRLDNEMLKEKLQFKAELIELKQGIE